MQVGHTNSSAYPVWYQVTPWLVQIPLLFYAVHGSFSLFSPNGAMAVGGSTVVDTDSGAGPIRLIVWTCTLIAVLLMFPLLNSIFCLFRRSRSVAFLVVLAIASVVWSQDWSQTLQRVIYLTVTTGFALYLAERFSTRKLMQVFILTGSIAICCSIVLAVAAPRYGIFVGRADASSGWQGIYSHKNTLGLMTVYFLAPALFAPAEGIRQRAWRFMYLGTSLFLIGMSRSRGAWIMGASLIAFSLVIKTARRMKAGQRVAAYWALGVTLAAGAIVCWALMPVLLGYLHKDVTLTGRTTIWSVLLTSFLKQPWLGFGYSAFWVGTRGESANAIYAINWPRLNYAENGILELALELGVAGVGLYFLAYLENYHRLRRLLAFTDGTPELFWYASILFLAAVTNIEAGYIAGANSMEWLIFVIVSAGIEKEYTALRHYEDNRDLARSKARFARSSPVGEMLEVL